MTTTTTAPATTRSRKSQNRKSITVTVEELPRSTRPSRKTVLTAAASGAMMFASFTPIDFGPLGWVALIPLIWLATLSEKPVGLYKAALIGGLVWTVPQVQWMRLASWPMYFAWALLAFYMALYFPAFVALLRTAVFRMRVPVPLAAGVMWVGLEYLRSHLMTGFPWYLLGHTQYRWSTLIQIADLGGASLVSFFLASFAGLCVMLWREHSHKEAGKTVPKQLMLVSVTWAVLFAGALGYGYWRLSSSAFTPGPRVALVQGNFPSELKHDDSMHRRIFDAHNRLTLAATAEQPDVIVWPESMYPYPLQLAAEGMTDEQLQAVTGARMTVAQFENNGVPDVMLATAMRSGASLLVGANQIIAEKSGIDFTNSAVFVDPDKGIVDSYDKIHRVPFGEYVPFVDQLPFLKVLEFLTPVRKGTDPKAFAIGDAKFLPLICFEDTIPYVSRNALSATQNSAEAGTNEILVNLTNDGWFKGSSEHNQHLITAQFRAIETRTPMVRAANMGISAIIDGNGVVVEPDKFLDADNTVAADRYEPPVESTMKDESGRYRKAISAVIVSGVPLDPRGSAFLTIGESIPALCLLLCIGVAIVGWRNRKVQVDTATCPTAVT